MNYHRIYKALIERARDRNVLGYTERHHVIPVCMGGSNAKTNLVDLTPEEHFLAHALLVKMHPRVHGLLVAAQRMCHEIPGRPRRVLYGWLRRRFAASQAQRVQGSSNPCWGTIWINNGTICKRIASHQEIPHGWVKGRSLRRFFCIQCKLQIASSLAKYCDLCRETCRITGCTKGRRYIGKSIAKDEEVLAALKDNSLDIDLAMSSLGYKPFTHGLSRYRFIVLKDQLLKMMD